MSSKTVESSGIQVLGVGLPRTGTASMKAALEILGYPCYHMFEVVANAEHGREWQRIFAEAKAGNESPGFAKVFSGYRATVDAPAETLWPLILKEYPHAKVLLTRRPGAAWKKSVDKTIMQYAERAHLPAVLIFWVDRLFQQIQLANRHLVPMWLEKYGSIDEHMMDKRIEEVMNRGLSSDQLLDYELGSGWQPLCKESEREMEGLLATIANVNFPQFLNKPIPPVDFPRVNDHNQFAEFMKGEIIKGLQRWAAVIGCAAVAVGVGLKFSK